MYIPDCVCLCDMSHIAHAEGAGEGQSCFSQTWAGWLTVIRSTWESEWAESPLGVCGWFQQQCRAGVHLFFFCWSPSCWPDFLTIFAGAQPEPFFSKCVATLHSISSVTNSLPKYKKANVMLLEQQPESDLNTDFQTTGGREGPDGSCKWQVMTAVDRLFIRQRCLISEWMFSECTVLTSLHATPPILAKTVRHGTARVYTSVIHGVVKCKNWAGQQPLWRQEIRFTDCMFDCPKA